MWREGIVLRLDDQSFFGVDVPLTHRGRRKVVAARGSKQCPFFLALCCLGKIPGGAPFSQLHKGGKQRRVDRP